MKSPAPSGSAPGGPRLICSEPRAPRTAPQCWAVPGAKHGLTWSMGVDGRERCSRCPAAVKRQLPFSAGMNKRQRFAQLIAAGGQAARRRTTPPAVPHAPFVLHGRCLPAACFQMTDFFPPGPRGAVLGPFARRARCAVLFAVPGRCRAHLRSPRRPRRRAAEVPITRLPCAPPARLRAPVAGWASSSPSPAPARARARARPLWHPSSSPVSSPVPRPLPLANVRANPQGSLKLETGEALLTSSSSLS